MTALDPREQAQTVVAAARALTEDLGVVPLQFNPRAVAYSAGLTGINVRSGAVDPSWNIHEWAFR